MPVAPSRGVTWAYRVLSGGLIALYLGLASPRIGGGDTAEFTTLALQGGVAHPPGYPLTTLLLGGLARLVPVEGPVHRVSLATALVALATLRLLFLACRGWGTSRFAAFTAVAVYGVGPLALGLGTEAEVFAPNALAAAGMLLAVAPGAPPRAGTRVLLAGLTFGLGLSAHPSAVFLAPLPVLGLVLAVREGAMLRGAVLRGMGGLALGLLPLAAIPILARLAGDGWTWGDPRSPAAVLGHLLRREYGTTGLVQGGQRAPLAQLGALLSSLADGWMVAFLAVGVLGFALALSRTPHRPSLGPRVAWGGLALAFAFAGPGFACLLDVPLESTGQLIVERFHLLPVLLLAPLVAAGLDAVVLWIERLRGGAVPTDAPAEPPGVWAVVVPLMLVPSGVLASLPALEERHHPAIEHYLVDTLRSLPSGAVLLGAGDHRVFGFLCAARILGVRPDVVYVDAFLVDRPWYRARVARALGTTVPDDARAEQILALAARAGRPVFLAGLPELQARLPAVPHGTVLRVLRRDELRPDAEALEASNRLLFQGFHLDDPAPRIQWSWAGDARTAYARAWVAIGQAHLTEGRPERALAAWTEASRLAPWLRLEVH